jgi:acyl-CoA thioesterase
MLPEISPQLAHLLKLLKLDQLDRDLFLGDPGRGEGLFGVLVAAQCVTAAYRTVEAGSMHSLHAYFLRPGRHDVPIRYVVYRIRDGKTFTTRDVVAYQAGEPIFPMSCSFARPEEGVSNPAQPMPEVPRGTRVLVIEDEEALGEAVAGALTDGGFRVDRAANGAEALAKVRERTYDVVICDLKMPQVDGMTFYREVSAAMPQIVRRLIFVTGDVAGTEAERFLEECGCRWLAKPFRLRDLVKTARETLR